MATGGGSCCRGGGCVAVVSRLAGFRESETGTANESSQRQPAAEQVVVSPVVGSHLLCSRLAGLPPSVASGTPPRLVQDSVEENRNCSKTPTSISSKRNRTIHEAALILIGVCILSIIIRLPQAQAHSLLASSTTNLKQQATLEESPTTTTTTTTTAKLSQDTTLYASSSQLLNLTTTTSVTTTTSPPTSAETSCPDCGQQDERPSSDHDDDDAESCPGLSEDAAAKAKNLSNTQRLVNLQSCLQKKIRRKLKDSTRDSMELFDKLSLTGGCSASLMSLMSSLGQIKSYAFKFFDASAKIPSGVLYGLLSDFGDFDQCLSIRSDPRVSLDMELEEHAFSGKYCLLDFHMNYHIELAPNETVPEGIEPDGILWDELVRHYWTSKSPKGFQIGMCFPSKCTDDDLDQLYKSLGDSYNFKGRILQCQDGFDLRAQHTPDLVQHSILYVFYIFLTMTLAGTILDRYGELISINQLSWYGAIHDVLTCFSLCRSWTIFTSLSPVTPQASNTRTSSSSNFVNNNNMQSPQHEPAPQAQTKYQPPPPPSKSCLSHLSGLRLFVILWITMGHSFLYPSASNYQHYRSIINMNITRDSVWFATTNFTLGIDMLLYMAGLVFVFKFASLTVELAGSTEKRSSSVKISRNSGSTGKIWCLLVEKIFRFWPTYFAVIALAIIVPLLGDGPMWPEMISRRIGESCRKNWWTNLLFINNFQRESELCLPSSWFVSVLMQLFLVGSLILVIEQKYSSRAAMVALSGLLVGSCAYSFAYAFHFRVNAPVIRMDESFVMEMDEDIWRLYTNIFNNLGPFLIGMLGGYQLLRFKQHSSSYSAQPVGPIKWSSISAGPLAELVYGCVFVGVAALVLSSVFYEKYSPVASSIYWSFHRIGWALFTGYLVHKCATGSWTLLKDFLSLSSFIPISRLIFVAYLVYPIFIHMHSGLVRDGLHVSLYNMFNVYVTRLVLTFSTALIIHLLFEIPLNLLEELLYRKLSAESATNLKHNSPVGHNAQLAPPANRDQGERRKESSSTGVLLSPLPAGAASMDNV